MNATPLSVRVNRLFALGHDDDAPEATTADVAAALSTTLGHPVATETVQAIRDGHDPHAGSALLSALAAHFHAPAEYLAGNGDHDYDTLIRFKLAVREAGVNHLSMRGSAPDDRHLSTAEMEQMIPMLSKLPNQLETGSR